MNIDLILNIITFIGLLGILYCAWRIHKNNKLKAYYDEKLLSEENRIMLENNAEVLGYLSNNDD